MRRLFNYALVVSADILGFEWVKYIGRYFETILNQGQIEFILNYTQFYTLDFDVYIQVVFESIASDTSSAVKQIEKYLTFLDVIVFYPLQTIFFLNLFNSL